MSRRVLVEKNDHMPFWEMVKVIFFFILLGLIPVSFYFRVRWLLFLVIGCLFISPIISYFFRIKPVKSDLKVKNFSSILYSRIARRNIIKKAIELGIAQKTAGHHGYLIPEVETRLIFKWNKFETGYIDIENLQNYNVLTSDEIKFNVASTLNFLKLKNLGIGISDNLGGSNWVRYWLEDVRTSFRFVANDPKKFINSDSAKIRLTKKLTWNSDKIPHMAISGRTGSGKSTLMTYITTMMTLQGWDVYVLDVKHDDMSAIGALFGSEHVATDSDEALKIVENISKKIIERQKKIRAKSGDEARNNYKNVGFKPIALICDEMGALSGSFERKEKQKFDKLLQNIAYLGRSSGIHLILGAQVASAEAYPTGVRSQLGARVLLGNSTGSERQFLFPTFEIPEKQYGIGSGIATFEGLEFWNEPNFFEAPNMKFNPIEEIKAVVAKK